MRKTLLSLLASICIAANAYATDYMETSIPKINRDIGQKTRNIAELCEKLYNHKNDAVLAEMKAKNAPFANNFPEPKKKYNEEQKKELNTYTINKNYYNFANNDFTKYGSLSYLLGYTNDRAIAYLGIIGTDEYSYRWNKYSHKNFMIHPVLERPKLYEPNEINVVGVVFIAYTNSNKLPPPTEDMFLKIEDNGADGIIEPNPVNAVWLNEVKDFEQEYQFIGKNRIPVNFTTTSSNKNEINEFNKLYLKLLSGIENDLNNSIEKLDK